MKGRLIFLLVVSMMVALVMLFSAGIALADNGQTNASTGTDWTALWLAVAAIGATLANLYLDTLKPMLAAVWAVKADPFWWKVRGSLLALGITVWLTLKAAYKKGLLDAVISILIKIVKNKLGIPTAAKKVGAAFNK